jgi:DNA repair protein RadA
MDINQSSQANFGIRLVSPKAFNPNHQILLAESGIDLVESLQKDNYQVRPLVMDSVTAHTRAEYADRSNLADCQRKPMRFADLINALILMTDLLMAKPETFFSDLTKPEGDQVLGHAVAFQLYLSRSKGDKCISRLVVSSTCLMTRRCSR